MLGAEGFVGAAQRGWRCSTHGCSLVPPDRRFWQARTSRAKASAQPAPSVTPHIMLVCPAINTAHGPKARLVHTTGLYETAAKLANHGSTRRHGLDGGMVCGPKDPAAEDSARGDPESSAQHKSRSDPPVNVSHPLARGLIVPRLSSIGTTVLRGILAGMLA